MTNKSVPPSIKETAFDCPHCGAYTTQHWFEMCAEQLDREERTPFIPDEQSRKKVLSDKDIPAEMKAKMQDWFDQWMSGQVFLEKRSQARYLYHEAHNVFLSQCYNCHRFAVWVHDRLLSPPARGGPQANPDLPDHIHRDYEEAQSIVHLSPRGAAALLRLCVQKLCVHLGERGKNLDDDIASLVKKGLNPLVQRSLDVVRVVGNEAVHPGVLDLKDDQDTANTLFTLVNLIVDQMVSHPKTVNAIYEKLPESKKAAIAARDGKTASDKT
ncbi:MAG: hypothetical protein A3H39_11120 [candidate division NC10 bacterium RIFCSPLOWO2_02_FULL_66_22]|nr:MAG: hypothetical protein A3H39_11120 [candidate division NC10 bacterium RIFCSPLOWO2_02_FULL_66_22]